VVFVGAKLNASSSPLTVFGGTNVTVDLGALLNSPNNAPAGDNDTVVVDVTAVMVDDPANQQGVNGTLTVAYGWGNGAATSNAAVQVGGEARLNISLTANISAPYAVDAGESAQQARR
jgi:hypothetical protein